MTILIENAETQEYLTTDGRWTKKMEQAATYRTSTLAKASATTAAIGRFNIIGAVRKSSQIVNLDDGCGAKKA
jgi:hypothetical protein